MRNIGLVNPQSFIEDDMSPYVVHFTKFYENKNPDWISHSILAERVFKAGSVFGIGKNFNECPKSVCFSEVPLHKLNRLTKRRAEYGIGFSKEFLIRHGGGPIMYAYKDTPHAKVLYDLVKAGVGNVKDPIWIVAPFIDSPGLYFDRPFFFEWEREWRHIGDLSFTDSDPAFLIFPEKDHISVRRYMDEKNKEFPFPKYENCPFICPKWDKERIEIALSR